MAREVLVIGAGVSGLTTAACLADAGYGVRIRATDPPQATTSRAAGAMWGGAFAGPAGKVTDWAAASLDVFRELAGVPGSGVHIASGTLASRGTEAPPPLLFPGVELRPQGPPAGFAAAFGVTLPIVDMPRYLDHLVARLERSGIAIEVDRVRTLEEAAAEAGLVVNCSGVGARELAADQAVRPVRGQHVVVENPGIEEFFIADPMGASWASWFPHGEQLVLGGIAQEDDWEMEPRAADADRILEACAAVEPRLADAWVIEQRVGLRPARDPVRVEAERIDPARVVHNYGHGGTGVALSWGCAREAVALLDG